MHKFRRLLWTIRGTGSMVNSHLVTQIKLQITNSRNSSHFWSHKLNFRLQTPEIQVTFGHPNWTSEYQLRNSSHFWSPKLNFRFTNSRNSSHFWSHKLNFRLPTPENQVTFCHPNWTSEYKLPKFKSLLVTQIELQITNSQNSSHFWSPKLNFRIPTPEINGVYVFFLYGGWRSTRLKNVPVACFTWRPTELMRTIN